MPHTLDVRCTSCGAKAFFEFAEVVRIREKKNVPFFQDNDQFDYRLCTDSCGQHWHAAIYNAGLHGRTVASIRELPEGYSKSDWEHSNYLYRSAGPTLGSILCGNCHLRSRHELRWPEDAYYQINYKSDVLWAFNDESASELRDFIASTDRKRHGYRWESFLMKVPTKFLRHEARNTIVKRLDRLFPPTQNSQRVLGSA